jgi:arylsulfatase A-like enzyme
MGRSARRRLAECAAKGQPFLLNVFMSHTHPPFATEYPYYVQFSDPDYRGESKFAMRRLTDPFEVIRSQAEPKKAFDLEQINALYDGAVRSFDDEVDRTLNFLEDCGLADNTIVVIYSDHGMDLFELNTWGQGNSVLGDSNRVPLIIVDPRRQGQGVVRNVVRSIDLVPTLLELSNLPSIHCDGRSLLPYLEGKTTDLQLHAFAETGLWLVRIPGMHPDHLDYPSVLEVLEVPDRSTGTLAVKPEFKEVIDRARDRMVVNNRWKLTYMPLKNGVHYQLFDLDCDPESRTHVSARHPEVVAALRVQLDKWIAAGNGKVSQVFTEGYAGDRLVPAVSTNRGIYRPPA